MSFLEVKGDINTMSGMYEGGYSPIPRKGNIKLTIEGNKLLIGTMFKNLHEVDISDITDIQLKSEQEISKDVTLTRLLTLGIFAFGLKKKRKKDSHYVIISTLEDGFSNDLVIDIGKGMGNTLAKGFVQTLKRATIK